MKPGLMAQACARPRRFIDGQAIVDVMPIVGYYVGRIDVERFDSVETLRRLIWRRVRTWGRTLSTEAIQPVWRTYRADHSRFSAPAARLQSISRTQQSSIV